MTDGETWTVHRIGRLDTSSRKHKNRNIIIHRSKTTTNSILNNRN